MKLTPQQVRSYQSLHKERFGTEISVEEALEQGTKLLCLLQLIYKPMSKMGYEQIKMKMYGTNTE